MAKKSNNQLFYDYYSKYFPGVKAKELYKNTKFLTADKINGGLLSKEELEDVEFPPTGYCFDLKDSGYLVLDVDVDDSFKYRTEMDLSSDAKLLGCNIDEFPSSIQITEYTINGGKTTIKSKNEALIVFCEFFDTRFVKTPSKGFHFYFENDLSEDQLKEIFGSVNSKYVKCFSLLNNTVDVDVFIDTKMDSNVESRLVLPFSKICTENKLADSHPNVSKNILVQYSGAREYKYTGFKKASCLVKWLKNHVHLDSIDYKSDYTEGMTEERYTPRTPIDVFESDKSCYLDYMRKNFKIISRIDVIKTYETYPFNLYLLMCVIVYFPICMHYDLLRTFIDTLKHKLSKNAKERLLLYYYSIRTVETQKKNWKGPQYLEAIINSKFGTNIKNRYRFICEEDKAEREDSSEEVLEEEQDRTCFNCPKEVAKAINKLYPEFPLPTGIN